MDEKIDIYNDKYEHMGTSGKKKAHEKGYWHRVFVCIVVNPRTKTIILQKKVPQRYSFDRPDYIDITVGGHYQAGENIEKGIRELKEEIGIETQFKDLVPIGIRQTACTINPDYIANEFQHMFLLPLDKKLERYKLEEAEVRGLIEFKIQDGIDLLLNRINGIKAKGYFVVDNKKSSYKIKVTRKDFVPAYLKNDKLFLRLFIASKRFLNGDKIDEILA